MLLVLSPRSSGLGRPDATRPLRVSCALRVGTKQLYTLWGLPGMLPASTLGMKGSTKSYQVSETDSSSDSTVSFQKDDASPDLEKTASVTEKL